jgi:hypothetical protein
MTTRRATAAGRRTCCLHGIERALDHGIEALLDRKAWDRRAAEIKWARRLL